jgi:predicted transcriptional regulator
MPDKNRVAKIVAAFARGNMLAADQLPGLITTVHAALSSAEGSVSPEPAVELVPAVPMRRSIQPNSIVCLDCGHEAKLLKRHLAIVHGLTPETYRRRWNLKSDYPLVAPLYAARRSEVAKAAGFGKQRRVSR